MKMTIRKENRFIHKCGYVFPGYIFFSFNLNIITWTKINSTFGVSKILTFNNKPSEISNHLIILLKKYYQMNNYPIKDQGLQNGDTIKLKSGLFADLIASVESVDEKNQIWVLLEAMGGIRKIKLQQTHYIEYNET